jgi:predicted kinase
MHRVALFVISGVMAAGKSTVARVLAGRLPRAVCVPGDAIRAMVVSGRVEMSPDAAADALGQLVLRYKGALAVAAVYLDAGFDVVVEDVIVGPVLQDFLALVPVDEFHLVFLDPEANAISEREQARAKTGYGGWSVAALQRILREETDRVGLWLDSTELTAEQTVDRILADRTASLVRMDRPVDQAVGGAVAASAAKRAPSRPS